MTDSDPPTPFGDVADPARYQGPERYINVATDFLSVELTVVQRRILRAIGEHQRVLIISGNGVGKSYGLAVANLAYLLRHPESTALATSGTYSVLTDVLWKPLRQLHTAADLPGRCLESPPRIEFADDGSWFFKCVSPRHPSSLEGRHAGNIMVSLEEADKEAITAAYIDSAESLLTSSGDRIVAVANPPEDEANVVADLMNDDRWHTVQFSSFESRNVKVDAGETDADRIPGLVDLSTIRDDWVNWVGEEWPGLETARTAHRVRDDLDSRWYRRRAGVIPPTGAATHRPFNTDDVEAAWDRTATSGPDVPSAVGIDVARSGDRTVLVGAHHSALRVHYSKQGADHATQESELRRILDGWMDADETPTVAVDAVGEGSGLSDRLAQAYPDVHRFGAGKTADQETEFKDCWSEALYELGAWLDAGGAIDDRHLREELLAAARTVRFDERHLASRGSHGATVLEASSKSAVKDQLGRSPDHFDAAAMACWAAAGHASGPRRVVRRRGGTDKTLGSADRVSNDGSRVVRHRSPGVSSDNEDNEEANSTSSNTSTSTGRTKHARDADDDREIDSPAERETKRKIKRKKAEWWNT